MRKNICRCLYIRTRGETQWFQTKITVWLSYIFQCFFFFVFSNATFQSCSISMGEMLKYFLCIRYSTVKGTQYKLSESILFYFFLLNTDGFVSVSGSSLWTVWTVWTHWWANIWLCPLYSGLWITKVHEFNYCASIHYFQAGK